MHKKTRLHAIVFLLSCILYYFIAYHIERHETWKLLSAFIILFGSYIWVYLKVDQATVDHWIYASIIFRFIFFFSIPTLSDDYLRFIWDGQLLVNGYHPFAHAPSFYFDNNLLQSSFERALYRQLPKVEYFTTYPPLIQGVFWLSVKLSPQNILTSVVVLRCFNIAAEIGSLWLVKKLVTRFNVPKNNMLLYALNPLIIIELVGNIHHEALMIFFILGCIFFLTKDKLIPSAISLGLAISVKLIPMILLPVFLFRMKFKNLVAFYLTCAVTISFTFIPLLGIDFFSGLSTGVRYYFEKFEFNASIYYLIREWGYYFYGFNIIQLSGWKLGVFSGVLIFLYSIVSRPRSVDSTSQGIIALPTHFLFIFLFYLLFVTTLHPWYITALLAVTIFTRYRFPILWSFMIFLTYAGYSIKTFEENLWITAAEYTLVLGCFVWELNARKKKFA